MNVISPIERDPGSVVNSARPNDLTREVYGVMGVPVDVTDMDTALKRVSAAAARAEPFNIATVNLNYLVTSRSDKKFREFLSASDLSTADSITIVWLARLLGAPIKERVTGADIFEALKSARHTARALKVFLFGGAEGVADEALKTLNAEPGGLVCAGSYYPGFCTVDEMSSNSIINTINSSNADFLVTALGAHKGQTWLQQNQSRLQIPIRAHLGATMNFQAGTVKRAPARMQKLGLEWLWRIKEEPHLWRRYWNDGIVLLMLLMTCVFPLIILSQWHQLKWGGIEKDLLIKRTEDHESVTLSINGIATERNIGKAASYFQGALAAAKDVVINFTGTRLVDARFMGLLLMLDKELKNQRAHLKLTGIPPQIERLFCLNGFEFLLGK